MSIKHKVTNWYAIKIGHTFQMQGHTWKVYKVTSYFYGFKEFFEWHIERVD